MTEQTPRWLPFSPWVLEWLRHISKLFLELSSQLDLKLQLAFLSLDKRSRTLEPARGHLAEDSLFFCLRALDLECPGRYHGLLLGLHSRFPWIVLDSLPGIDVWFFLQGEQGSSVGDPGRRNLSRKLQTASWLGFLGGSFWNLFLDSEAAYFWILDRSRNGNLFLDSEGVGVVVKSWLKSCTARLAIILRAVLICGNSSVRASSRLEPWFQEVKCPKNWQKIIELRLEKGSRLGHYSGHWKKIRAAVRFRATKSLNKQKNPTWPPRHAKKLLNRTTYQQDTDADGSRLANNQ